ncbi:MAG TPA: GMC family oxidoreductase [Acidobacteriota bacterium]|nr:GMC family oxidoreductase [Acidobacteriota bacterium]
MSSKHYDIIIIGTGAGGGTLLHKLAPSGKSILVLERGQFLPREKANWDTREVFHKERYHTGEIWFDAEGRGLRPGTGYWVGGNTKVYGAALLRLRREDFGEVTHRDGLSPAWPLSYLDFEPYYCQAEKLYHVHGRRGDDPTEPDMSSDFPLPPVSHEPRIQELHDKLRSNGFSPFHVPLGIRLNEENPRKSACIRCDTCDGFPCLVDAKADSDLTCVRPALSHSNVTLLTGAKVKRLLTDPKGRSVSQVEATIEGRLERFKAGLVVVSCGAINSAALLLASANDRHPAGLANGSDWVGRGFMKHNNAAMVGLSRRRNDTVFQKTLAINDFYWGEKNYAFPMGHVQLLGKVNKDMMALDAPSLAPGIALDEIAHHSVDWWLTGEDLPDPDNRVRLNHGKIVLHYRSNNDESFDRLLNRWTETVKAVDCGDRILPCSLYMRKKIPLQAVAHQCGTIRFGNDPKTSVLNTDCRTHEVDNLYVVDGSFFPSSGAVNPSLTIMANALRVGEHLLERLG